MKKKTKKICLLFAGGTTIEEKDIWDSSVNNAENINNWLKQIPELSLIAEIEPIFVCRDYKELAGIKLWQKISQIIYKKINNFDGFVILCEPETVLYTSIALSFALLNLNKPVILTGSQISEEAIQRPDWQEKKAKAFGGLGVKSNLINAVQLATFVLPAVGLLYGNRCLRPVRAIRTAICALNIFESLDETYLAKIDFGISPVEKIDLPKNKMVYRDKFDPSVIQLSYYPNLNFNLVKNLIKNNDGLLITSYSNEPLPTDFINQLGKLKIPVIVYCKLDAPRFNKRNIIEVNNLTPATVFVKFMWALGQTKDLEELRKIMYQEYCFELIDFNKKL